MVEGYLEELQGMRKPRAGGSTGHGPCRSIWRAAGITWFDVPVRATIYLPDDLARAVEAYLKEHPETSLSALVRRPYGQGCAATQRPFWSWPGWWKRPQEAPG